MRNNVPVRVGGLALLLCLSVADMDVGAAEGAGGQTGGGETGVQVMDTPPVSGRLRFRRGPVCTCASGLSEKDIRSAEKAGSETDNKKGLNERP